MKCTARSSSRSQDTPSCEWGWWSGGPQVQWDTVVRSVCSLGFLTPREYCARGWNLLSLFTGFFPPSTTLMPYVTKFLQDSGPSQGALGWEGRWGPPGLVLAGWGGAWTAHDLLMLASL